jgi:hypothetical protein
MCEENNWDCYLCPCKECHGGHRYSIRTIREHLRECGRDPFLMCLMVGGDLENGFPAQGIWIHHDIGELPDRNVFDDADMHTKYGEQLDPFHDIQ